MSDSQNGSGRRRFLKGTGVAAVSLGLAGCSQDPSGGDTPTSTPTQTEDQTPTDAPTNASDIPKGGIFNFGMGTAPKGINPLSTSSAYSWVILDQIYEGGTSTDPINFEVHPNVFTDWQFEEVSDGGNDDNDQPNVNIYFNVREGLTWNDGKKLTVDQVIWSYNYLLEQKPGRYVSTMNPVTAVEKSDKSDWDAVVRMNKPIGTYASSQLSVPILPKHKWEGVSDFKTYEPYKNGGPIGLGPGVVTKYQPDTSVEVSYKDRKGEYTLSDLSWRKEVQGVIPGGPFVDAVRIRVYGSESALNQAFLEGQIDSMYSGIRTSRIDDVKKAEGLSLVDGFDTGYSHFSFNLRKTPLNDLAFRQMLGFAFDDVYWVSRLQRGYAQEGDFVMPPGYTAVRPETGTDAKLLKSPATQAFHFRQSSPGVVDVQGVRKFLTSGTTITGDSGTFVGKKYPGSLTGVKAGQDGAKHEYTFGSVQSQVLKESDANPDKEIRVNGKTITEINGGPLVMFVYPAKDAPQTAQMVSNYISSLQSIGIPIKRQVMTFNTMLGKVYGQEDFDIFPMGWVSLSPFATGTLYSLFHSDNADDHSVAEGSNKKKNTQTLLNNPMGYGLTDDASADDLISQARTTLETKKRNDLARQAVERIYLDFPTMITSYDVTKWPINEADWDGFIGNIPGPGSTYLFWQFLQVHQAKQ